MENENMFPNNCCNFFNPISENCSADQSVVVGGGVDFYESALSSMVSSPTASNHNNGNNGETLKELIGRLGSICNNNNNNYGGEISPQPYNIHNNNSTRTSCYSTPLNSPPKLNLSNHPRHQIRGNVNLPNNQKHSNSLQSLPQFSTDPGFIERAAMFSCFANNNNNNNNLGGFVPQLDSSSSTASSIVASSSHHNHQIRGKISASDMMKSKNLELNDSRENSTVSEQIIPGGEIGIINGHNDSKKRKSSARGKGRENAQLSSNPRKHVPSENNEASDAKRIKSEDDQTEKDSGKNANKPDANKNQNNSKDNSKNTEPPKDYIHVRARRGQATDAHSLAERVRREKISERMKVLQDLVPGCNKVTGKAVMLDEIINYVQSLQRQVEFLSMKLATVNPRMDFNMQALAPEDMFQSLGGSFPHNTYASDCYSLQAQAILHSSIHNGTEEPFIHPSHYNETMSQASTFLEDDLHSVVQMGFLKNQAQLFDGMLATAQMKAEQ